MPRVLCRLLQVAVLSLLVAAPAMLDHPGTPGASLPASSALPATMGPVPVSLTPARTTVRPRDAVLRQAKHPVAKHSVVRHPVARHTVARPQAARRAAPRQILAEHPRRETPHVVRLTAQQRLERAVARLPGYWVGAARWYLVAKDGYWGTADWYHDVIYISPSVPAYRIYDVVAHEWSHLLSVKAYGSVGLANARMNSWFGGTGVTGAERAADCMARLLGAQWTHYTSCADPHWQQGAEALLSGGQV